MYDPNRCTTAEAQSADQDSAHLSNKFSTISPGSKPYKWTTTDDFSSPTESFDADELNDPDYDANSPDKIYLTVGDSVTVEHLEKVVKPRQDSRPAIYNNAFLPPKPAKSAFDEVEFQRRSQLSSRSSTSSYHGACTAFKQYGYDDAMNTRESMPSQSFSEMQGDQMHLYELIESSHSRQPSSIDDSSSQLVLKDVVREAAKECSLPSGKK